MRYRKGKETKAALLTRGAVPRVTGVTMPPPVEQKWLLGMLYVVRLSLVKLGTREKIVHRILMIGCEEGDIERKLRWMFPKCDYAEFSVTKIERVREKMHILQTWITEEPTPAAAIIERADGTQNVFQNISNKPADVDEDYGLYAVGIATKMPARDELHALRKVGRALIAKGSPVSSDSAPMLSDDASVSVQEISPSSGFALPRNMENTKATAHFVRG